MRLRSGALALLLTFGSFAFADDAESKDVATIILTRTDSLPDETCTCGVPDPYFEGYIQALVDIHYGEYRVTVIVKDRVVYLANMPCNEMIAKSMASFVLDIPGVCEVVILDGIPPEDECVREKYVHRPQLKGIWFPQMTELFLPLIADPRNATYCVGWRAGDHVIGVQTGNVSLGDDFAIYRWLDLFWNGDLQIGIEAAIWSVFNMNPHPNLPAAHSTTELVNTDFYVGIPLTYASGPWSFRFRLYHISGHLGDEYMVNHPNVVRLNPSVEVCDFFASYQLNDAIRLYVGPGVYLHSDPTFRWKPIILQYGTEVRFLGTKFTCQNLYGTCFLAMQWRNLEQLHYNFDGTYRAGYEFSKLQGIGRKLRFYVGFHHGYSLEGQFAKMRTHYWEFNLNYGF
jgi:hypothetical protein